MSAKSLMLSPSLRGSGLKSTYLAFGNQMARVSLFTREWIEIRVLVRINIPCDRSPSLRGSGLKLSANQHLSNQVLSPSLRGSGLKFFCLWFACKIAKSPSLRGSGLKLHFTRILRTGLESPSLRGSGLKSRHLRLPRCCGQSPSLRGSGLKYNLAHVVSHFIFVSLFTREWIEISSIFPMVFAFSRLPLYEGVD